MRIDSNTYQSTAFNSRIDTLLIHSMNIEFHKGMEILTQKLSSHYVIADNCFIGKDDQKEINSTTGEATIFSLVPEEMRAWHAGVGSWKVYGDVNTRSIGIEVCGYYKNESLDSNIFAPRYFTKAEIASVIILCKNILQRHPDIKPINILAHSDIAPGRKGDPGYHFPWKKLYENGIGAWPDSTTVKKIVRKWHRCMAGLNYG